MESFTNLTSDYSNDTADYCKYPNMVFKLDHRYNFNLAKKSYSMWHPSEGKTRRQFELDSRGEWEEGERKRRRSSSSQNAFTHLIASLHDSHSAQRLCESETSHGPDFVSHKEGLFCDMDTRKLWPLCNSDGANDVCYHWETHSLVDGTVRAPRNYSHVEEWD